MRSARAVGATLVLLAASACFRSHPSSLCPYDESLGSSISREFSSDTGVIAGRVISIALQPLAGSHVTLLPLDKRSETRDDGRFHFDHLSPGDYQVVVERTGFGRTQRRVRVLANGGAELIATLGASVLCLTTRWADPSGIAP